MSYSTSICSLLWCTDLLSLCLSDFIFLNSYLWRSSLLTFSVIFIISLAIFFNYSLYVVITASTTSSTLIISLTCWLNLLQIYIFLLPLLNSPYISLSVYSSSITLIPWGLFIILLSKVYCASFSYYCNLVEREVKGVLIAFRPSYSSCHRLCWFR